MIVWLASYPRSGNTLLRTIIRHCFDFCSFADEPVRCESEFRSNSDLIGHKEFHGDWDAFYRGATAGDEIVLVKTHQAPIDSQPFIYVVRDGRSALQSYQKFNKDYNGVDKSLTSLILGDDIYGDWSSHYRQWTRREVSPRLVLRFEDLIDPSEKTLDLIADLIGACGHRNHWRNPVNELSAYEPNFFNLKSPVFKPNAHWSDFHQLLFDRLHRDLMTELGYYPKTRDGIGENAASDKSLIFINEVACTIQTLIWEKRSLADACSERLELIRKLQVVCDERLTLINKLHGKANRGRDE